MSILKKLAGQTVIYGASTILSRLLNLVFTPFYTRLFPKAVYGIYTHLYAYISFVNVVITFGMETTIFRFIQDSKDPQKVYNQAFFWVLSLSLVFGLLAGLLHPWLAAWMGYEGQERMILMLVGIIILDANAALPLAKLRHEERVKRFSFVMITNVLITLAANFVFVWYLRLGIEYVFFSNLIASVVRLSMALWGNLPTSLRPNWELLRGMLDYAFYIMLAGFAGIMNETLDRIMIPERWPGVKAFLGEELLGPLEMEGIYGANYKVAMLIALSTQAFRYAVEPFFFKEAKSKNSPETFARIFHYFSLVTLAGFLILASFAQEIVSFGFFGIPELLGKGSITFVDQAYWSGLRVVPVLLLAYVFSAAYIQLSIWFKITKQTRFAILFTGTGATITILVNYFGIPVYGYLASAWATLLCYAVMSVMVYFAGQKYYPIPYRITRILLYTGLFLLAYFANRQIGPTDGYWLAFVMKALICLGAGGIVLFAERFLPLFAKEETS
jgi:O-antigen/teichoic acid export membrane protein